MNKKTLKALRGSIAKWAAIVDSTDVVDRGMGNCPLCHIYCVEIGTWCDGCPVKIATSEHSCGNTPYEAWVKHHDTKHKEENDYHRIRGCSTCMRLAMTERDFLKGLLPKKEEA